MPSLSETLPATEATLDSVRTKLDGTVNVAGPLTDAQLAARGLATQTTLSAVLAKLSADPATQTTLSAVLAGILAPTPAGESIIGLVGGVTYVNNTTPAVTAVTYSAGQTVGSLMTLTGLGRVSGGSGLIHEIIIRSKSAQTSAQLDLVLFDANPSATTFTNATTMTINSADLSKVIAVIPVTDWKSLGGTQCVAQAIQLARSYKITTGQTNGFAVLVARSSISLSSATDLEVLTKALQD